MKYPKHINKDNSGFVSLIAASILLTLAVLFSGGLALAQQDKAAYASAAVKQHLVITDTIVVTATRLR
jgi:hypothetical protein